MGDKTMPTVHQDQVEKSVAHLLYDLAGAFVALLVYIGYWSGLYRAVHWLQDEWRRNALIRELSGISDYYLNDVAINRSEIDEVADVTVKRLRESRNHPT
jgi:uncharacterized protein YjiS (DUF1127 family)